MIIKEKFNNAIAPTFFRRLKDSLPVKFACFFGTVDIFFLMLLHLANYQRGVNEATYFSDHWRYLEYSFKVWNAIHLPIRRVIEPVLFPVVTFHPFSVTQFTFILYQAICILQSVVIGFIVGVLINLISVYVLKKSTGRG